MAARKASLVQQRQGPLRERYRSVPAEAWIRDSAQTINACAGDPFHGTVVPANGAGAPLRFGIHRSVGGFHDQPNPGDILSAALAACFDSTLRILADHLGVRLESVEVKVEAECDVRGCLLVNSAVPVGFQRMCCRVLLQPKDEVDEEAIQMLVAAAENSCVVLQTLRNGVSVQTQIETRHAGDAISAAVAR
ncbi:MAG: OsmC family protein [Gemmatimonadota bacterium]